MTQARRNHRPPIRPERLRKIDGGFAFIPHRFLHDGFLASLSPTEIELYFFLVLAGDRQGLSYYHYDRICSVLQMDLDTYVDSRNRLIERDLLAFDGTRFQILSLPERPVARSPKPGPALDLLGDRDDCVRQAILRNLRDSLEDDQESGATDA